MNGIHDLGGMHGFGPVERRPDEPLFHADWERRVVGILPLLIARRLFSIDAFRFGIERMAPQHYLRAPYFERWRTSVERLLCELGLLERSELEERYRRLRDGEPIPPASPPAEGPTGEVELGFLRHVDRPPRFAAGQAVRARNLHPRGHTRLPRYVRGHVGTVTRVYPACVFPDTNAERRGEDPQHLYHVRFEGETLWGEDAEPHSSVEIDLFESYLEPADGARAI